jgi:hypothetical protein
MQNISGSMPHNSLPPNNLLFNSIPESWNSKWNGLQNVNFELFTNQEISLSHISSFTPWTDYYIM